MNHIKRSKKLILINFLVSIYFLSSITANNITLCESPIYCEGVILDTIQLSGVFNDSKTFVDMEMKYSEDTTVAAFTTLSNSTDLIGNRTAVKKFIEDYFTGPDTELEVLDPGDWHEHPSLVDKVKDPELKKFTLWLHNMWKGIYTKVSDKVFRNSSHFSIISVENPFIVPDTHFREYYYWDSYWVVLGLLNCNMTSTAHGIIQNYISLVRRYGHIPSGGRIYYLGTSEPPLLTQMVSAYYTITHDKDFLENVVDALELENRFWTYNRTTHIQRGDKSYPVVYYNVTRSTPRPDQYKEDMEAISNKTEDEQMSYLSNVASACESGWHNSSRWSTEDRSRSPQTSNIVPVDLNVFIYWNEKTLSQFYQILGDSTRQAEYSVSADLRLQAVNTILWDSDSGAWFDYNIDSDTLNRQFYPTNVFPLLAGCYDVDMEAEIVEKVLNYIKSTGISDLPGGIPASMSKSPGGGEWDYPNVWAPLVHLFVQSLDAVNNTEAKELAFSVAQKWVNTTYMAWIRHRNVFDKYDVENVGNQGTSNSEPHLHTGTSWTIGATLTLLSKYSDRLTTSTTPLPHGGTSGGVIAAVIIVCILIVAVVVVIYVCKVKKGKKFPTLISKYNYNQFPDYNLPGLWTADDDAEERRNVII